MKLPKSIKINGYNYKVQVVDNLKDPQGHRLNGAVFSGHKLIQMDKDVVTKRNPQFVLEVLIHETIHGILWGMGDAVPMDQQEKITELLGVHLTGTLLANPKLVELIKEVADQSK